MLMLELWWTILPIYLIFLLTTEWSTQTGRWLRTSIFILGTYNVSPTFNTLESSLENDIHLKVRLKSALNRRLLTGWSIWHDFITLFSIISCSFMKTIILFTFTYVFWNNAWSVYIVLLKIICDFWIFCRTIVGKTNQSWPTPFIPSLTFFLIDQNGKVLDIWILYLSLSWSQ